MNTFGWNRFERRATRAVRWHRYVALGLIAYPLLSTTLSFSITGPTTHPSKEVFPFFTWSLFSKVMDVRREFEIKVLAINNEATTGEQAKTLRAVMSAFGESRLGYKALQNVGRSLRRSETGAEEKRQSFERRYFNREDIDYEIIMLIYNPLERWRDSGSYDQLETVGHYNYQGRS